MSGANRARQRRAGRNITETVMQAHDRLHKGDVDAAHSLIHVALGLEEPVRNDVAPLSQRRTFDEEFRSLCVRHDVRATYVMIDRIDAERGARLMSGGDAELCAVVDERMRAGGAT